MATERKVPPTTQTKKAAKKQGEEAEMGAEEAEILENLPPEAKKAVEMMISMQRISGPMPNPIISKLTEDHITKILDQSASEDLNSYKDNQSSKGYNLVYFILIMVLIVFLVVYLSDRNNVLLSSLLDRMLYILGGFGTGYGFKAYKDAKKS